VSTQVQPAHNKSQWAQHAGKSRSAPTLQKSRTRFILRLLGRLG